jgi:hypothetical protein
MWLLFILLVQVETNQPLILLPGEAFSSEQWARYRQLIQSSDKLMPYETLLKELDRLPCGGPEATLSELERCLQQAGHQVATLGLQEDPLSLAIEAWGLRASSWETLQQHLNQEFSHPETSVTASLPEVVSTPEALSDILLLPDDQSPLETGTPVTLSLTEEGLIIHYLSTDERKRIPLEDIYPVEAKERLELITFDQFFIFHFKDKNRQSALTKEINHAL